MDEKFDIPEFKHVPSSEEFLQSEATNVPAVFRNCICDWPAITKWNPNAGGLCYLKDKAGCSVVEAMFSRSGSVFYGDIRSHERISIPFSMLISLCEKSRQIQNDDAGTDNQEKHPSELESIEGLLDSIKCASHIYLAQAPILNKDSKADSSLEALCEDITMPRFLDTNAVSNINLWMNVNRSRSSTHYDPYHNLLCIIAGCKQVLLWPPSAAHLLYPKAIYGEASNHSAVDVVNLDLKVYPQAQNALAFSQKVSLQPGDALFLPEGWFHQVDSDDLTIAVNLWWPSKLLSSMQPHMDAYYLRRIISRMVDREKERRLQSIPLSCVENKSDAMHYLSVDKQDLEHANVTSTEGNGSLDKCSPAEEAKIQLDAENKISIQQVTAENLTKMEQPQLQRTSNLPPQNTLLNVQGEVSANVFENRLTDSNSSLSLHNSHSASDNPNDSYRNRFILQNLDSFESQILGILISSIHEKMNKPINLNKESGIKEKNVGQIETNQTNIKVNEGDIVAKLIAQLKPLILRKVLLVMANQFPRTLEALVLHVLSPIATEILTKKFDEMDKEVPVDEQHEFYKIVYGVFGDQQDALEAILNGKERFAYMAFKHVLNSYLEC